eukprot:Gb_02994 [translate_table: standard]
MESDSWNINGIPGRKIITSVKHRNSVSCRQILGTCHKGISKSIIGFRLQPRNDSSGINDNAVVTAIVELKDGRRDGNHITAHAHAGKADVVEGVHTAIFQHGRHNRAPENCFPAELKCDGGVGISVD